MAEQNKLYKSITKPRIIQGVAPNQAMAVLIKWKAERQGPPEGRSFSFDLSGNPKGPGR
jgi:hypothetical protein